jgi:hypothetical protein
MTLGQSKLRLRLLDTLYHALLGMTVQRGSFMKKLLLVSFFVLSASVAQADLNYCEGKTEDAAHTFQVTIDLREDGSSEVHLRVVDAQGVQTRDETFKNVHLVGERNAQGSMTAPGLSIHFQRDFGFIRNAVVTSLNAEEGKGSLATAVISECKPVDDRHH